MTVTSRVRGFHLASFTPFIFWLSGFTRLVNPLSPNRPRKTKQKYRQLIDSQRYITKLCGSGGNRTLVRTRKPYAFYMLIPAFIFVMQQDPDHQLHPYPLKLHPIIEAWQDYFRFNLRRWIFGFGTTSSERRLVLLPGSGIEPQSTVLRLGSESILIVAN